MGGGEGAGRRHLPLTFGLELKMRTGLGIHDETVYWRGKRRAQDRTLYPSRLAT